MDNGNAAAYQMQTVQNYARYLEAALLEERAKNTRLLTAGAEVGGGGDSGTGHPLDLSISNQRPPQSITAGLTDRPPPPIIPVTSATAAFNVRPPLGIPRDAPDNADANNEPALDRGTQGATSADVHDRTHPEIMTRGPSRTPAVNHMSNTHADITPSNRDTSQDIPGGPSHTAATNRQPPQSNARITPNIFSENRSSNQDKPGSTAIPKDSPPQHQDHDHSPSPGLEDEQLEDGDDDEAADDGQVPIEEHHERKPMEQLLTEARMLEGLIQEELGTLKDLEKDITKKKGELKRQRKVVKWRNNRLALDKKRIASHRRILQGLRAHIGLRRGVQPPQAMKKGGLACPQCPASFERNLFLQRHLENAHAEGKVTVACPQCGIVMSSYPNILAKHMNRYHRR